MKKFGFMAVAALFALTSCGASGGGDNDGAEDVQDSLQEIIETQDSVIDAMREGVNASDADAEAEEVETADVISFRQVIRIIDDAWQTRLPDDYPLLQQFGLTCLKYEAEQDGEIMCSESFYGKNAAVKVLWNKEGGYREFKVVPTGRHAMVIRLSLSSDNYEEVLFSDKEDYDRFVEQISPDYEFEGIGRNGNGMYVVQGHMG